MKSKLFLYLFLSAILYIIFQYTNAKKTFETQEERIEELEVWVDKLKAEKDSIATFYSAYQNFSLQTDDKGKKYIEDLGYNIDDFTKILETQILSLNKPDADNQLVPYSGMEGYMRINSLRILNHKWVIIEFTDGVYWGEALVNYYIEEDGSITFEVSDGFIYPN